MTDLVFIQVQMLRDGIGCTLIVDHIVMSGTHLNMVVPTGFMFTIYQSHDRSPNVIKGRLHKATSQIHNQHKHDANRIITSTTMIIQYLTSTKSTRIR